MVYVLAKDGTPLMPTKNHGYVRVLLDSYRAVVVRQTPFTIRLKHSTTTYTQPLVCGIDPGRTNIGIAVVTEDGECVFSANADTHNKDIPKHMAERKLHRQASRHGERLRRQRRAKAAGTCFTEGERQRILHGCKEPITCKNIKNSEARFNNRKREEGWFTPTANHLLASHLSLLNKVRKILPISKMVLELNSFAFMAMENPNIRRWQYQKGPLYGKGSVKDAVFASQGGTCLFCDSSIQHYHHIVPRSKGGSNTLPNIVGLCENHHRLVHTDSDWQSKMGSVKAGCNKKYGALSVLNQIIPALTEALSTIPGIEVAVTDGRSTKAFRNAHQVDKDHHLDAYCIACSALSTDIVVNPPADHYSLRRFRRHDRAVMSSQEERKYYLDGKLVARNRNKRTGQTVDSLVEFRAANSNDIGKLRIVKGIARYKDPTRILPGGIFFVNGKQLVFQGSRGKHNGKPDYYTFVGLPEKIRPAKCVFISKGGGWQFV